jgi:hypothetical protein
MGEASTVPAGQNFGPSTHMLEGFHAQPFKGRSSVEVFLEKVSPN